MLYRWFVGLGMDDVVGDATTFTKNRDRLLEGDIAVDREVLVRQQALRPDRREHLRKARIGAG